MPVSTVTDIYQGRARVQFNEGRHTYMVRVHGHVDKLWQPSISGILGVKAKGALTTWAARKSLEYVGKKLGEFESKLGAPPFTMDTREVHSWLSEAADGWNVMEEASIGTVAHRFLHAELSYRCGKSPDRPIFPVRYDPVLSPDLTQGMIDQINAVVTAGMSFFDDNHFEPLFMERVLWSPTLGVIGTADFVGKVNGKLSVLDYKSGKKIYPEAWVQMAAYAKMYEEEFGQYPLDRYAVNVKRDGGLEVEKRSIDTWQADFDAFLACLTLYTWERENDPYKKGTPVQVLGDLDLLIARPQETR
jgi:PD-(D/E)XK nuclease superfamily